MMPDKNDNIISSNPEKNDEFISGILAAAAKKSNQQIVECEKCHRTYFLDSCVSRRDGYELCPACRKFFVLRCAVCGKKYRVDIFDERGCCSECTKIKPK